MTLPVLADRVRVNIATAGTGTVTCGAVVTNAFLTPAEAGVVDGQQVRYVLEEGADFEEGTGTYTASGTTISRDTVSQSKIGGTAGTTKMTLAGAAVLRLSASAADIVTPGLIGLNAVGNLRLSPSVSGNALTIAVKTKRNADPSVVDPVVVNFRNGTLTTGDDTSVVISAALSVVVPSGQAVGTANSTPGRVWVLAINNAGAVELAVVNCLVGGASPTAIYPLNECNLLTTTAIAAAPSAGVPYSTTARTSKAFRILGYVEYTSGLATAGTWSAAPDIVQLFGSGIKKPGDVVQEVFSADGASSNSATHTPFDDTIPQNTEGAQVMSLAITPTSPANILLINHDGVYSSSAADHVTVALHQDSVANALAAATTTVSANGYTNQISLLYRKLCTAVAAATYKIRAGTSANTMTFNGTASARDMGGVYASILKIAEIMA